MVVVKKCTEKELLAEIDRLHGQATIIDAVEQQDGTREEIERRIDDLIWLLGEDENG